MTVGESYEGLIDLDEIEDKAEDDEYWESCSSFVYDVWDRDIATITPKQRAWLDKIVEGLEE